jgi:hypothetical protein
MLAVRAALAPVMRPRGEARGARVPVRAATEPEDAKPSSSFTNADTFTALGALKSTENPFASRSRAPSAPSPTTGGAIIGFTKPGVDVASLPSTRDADVVLKRFDDTQRKESTSDALTACTKPALAQSTRALASRASRVMLGVCASDAAEGLSTLKSWTSELGLPRGKLHGMDRDGVPIDPPKGAVFIKYNSLSGDAYISGYGGDYRGVLFTPELADAAFRQYGYLPLDVLN